MTSRRLQGHRVRSERYARGAIDAHHALLRETRLVGRANGFDVILGAGGRLMPDDQDLGLLLRDPAVAAAPLPGAIEDGEACRETRRHLGVQKPRPFLFSDRAAL